MKIITLTLSCAFDLHLSCEELVPGHENFVSVSSRSAGGKGINCSRALCALGVENTAVALLGDEQASEFLQIIEADGVSAVAVITEGRIRENITVHPKEGKETRISIGSGRAGAQAMGQIRERLLELFEDGCTVAMMGSVPEGIELSELKKLLKELKARGARIVIDSRSFGVADLAEVGAYLIKPNEEELARYTSAQINGVDSAIAAARMLHGLGIENVLVTLGEAGAVLVNSEGVTVAEAPRIKALSTIGAGDSTVAGFLAGKALGQANEDCLALAVATGSAACLTEGTAPPRKEDIERLRGEVRAVRE